MVGKLLTLDFLKGRRTQIVALIVAGLTLALNMGWVTPEQHGNITSFLISIGLLTAAAHSPKE